MRAEIYFKADTLIIYFMIFLKVERFLRPDLQLYLTKNNALCKNRRHHLKTFLKLVYIFSITIADAPPPPLQMPAAPYLALFCFNTFINVTIILAPLQPSG